MEKQAHFVKFDDRGKPTAILYRTKDGLWVWMGVKDLDEEEQVDLMTHNEIKNPAN